MFGELIIMIVYLPILTLEGIEGKLFRPMALTVLFALARLARVVVDADAGAGQPRFCPNASEEQQPWIVSLVEWLYAPALLAGWTTAVLGWCGLDWVSPSLMALELGTEFVPRLRRAQAWSAP